MKNFTSWNDVKIGETFKFAGDLFRKISKMKAIPVQNPDRKMTMNKHMLCEIVHI